MNYYINLNLSKLDQASIQQNKQGEEYLVIPVNPDFFYRSEKGIFLNLIAKQSDKMKFNQSHYVQLNLNKEVKEKLTEEQKKNLFIGAMKSVNFQNNNPKTTSETSLISKENQIYNGDSENFEDLPF